MGLGPGGGLGLGLGVLPNKIWAAILAQRSHFGSRTIHSHLDSVRKALLQNKYRTYIVQLKEIPLKSYMYIYTYLQRFGL